MLPQQKPQPDQVPSSLEETAVPVAIVLDDAGTAGLEESRPYTDKKKLNHQYRKPQPLRKHDHGHSPSRFHARGITYNAPLRCYVGALATVLFLTSLFLSLLVPLHIFAIQEIAVVDIVILSVLLVSVILYFSVALPCRCRVCRTQLFSLRRFLRNKKAHYVPLIGYNIPTGLHVMLFRWFRCQACGTSQKLSRK